MEFSDTSPYDATELFLDEVGDLVAEKRKSITSLWLSGGVGYVAENLSRVGHVQ